MLHLQIILAAVPCDEDRRRDRRHRAHGGWRIHPGKPHEADGFERRVRRVGIGAQLGEVDAAAAGG